MATATTVAAFKAAFKAALASRPGLQGVQVAYGDGDARRRESIRLRESASAEVTPTALTPGRRKREENYTVRVEVDVTRPGAVEDCEARAVALMAEVEGLLAEDPNLGGVVDGLLFALVTAWEMDSGQTTDGPRTVIDVSVTVRSRLA